MHFACHIHLDRGNIRYESFLCRETSSHLKRCEELLTGKSAILIGDCTLPVTYISTEATFDMKVSSVEKLPHTSRDAKNF
ncbi:hypothetical protein TVAGG3_0417500 [Trichomonas vaginalis G3]|uniref:hypothetical protein n=1 Tax=Trichomonas vaginalis (strain ATCC PRA-98 / G3) TaxID=412133 RepID=UPI0021E56EAD|nr:hypothetical protein TVAGG3_0417500 [Trichomonas vaginalis G3]KAI5535804.1 hypothetical protein TVAGG3_0417500 [Trichomonas vaginalis G3]